MRISWDEDSTVYKAVCDKVLDKYGWTYESILVQIKIKYSEEKEYCDLTELLINVGLDSNTPDYIWENNWWEGQQDVKLIAAAPTSQIDLSVTEDFCFDKETYKVDSLTSTADRRWDSRYTTTVISQMDSEVTGKYTGVALSENRD